MEILTQEELSLLLEKTGALLKGHFLLTSGNHSTRYLQCAKLLQHPDIAERIGAAIADKFKFVDVDVVVAPAIGGIIVAHEVARALGVRAVFSERDNGEMTFRRGLEINDGELVLAVEDVITTGGSVKETIEAAERAGGKVVAVASILDRSGGKADFGHPFKALMKADFPIYSPESLPPELQGSTAVKPGSRKI